MNLKNKNIKLYLNTNKGPGTVTVHVQNEISIDEVKNQVTDQFREFYEWIEVTDFEILSVN